MDALKKWMIIWLTPHQTIKIDVIPKTFLQVIFAANWLVQRMSLNQQRRPLPFPLYLSLFYDLIAAVDGLVEALHPQAPVCLPGLVRCVPHTEWTNSINQRIFMDIEFTAAPFVFY